MRKIKALFTKREWILDDHIIGKTHYGHMESKKGNFFEFVIAVFKSL